MTLLIIAEEIDQAQEVLSLLEQEAEGVGLYCNAKKTVASLHDTSVEIKGEGGKTLNEDSGEF